MVRHPQVFLMDEPLSNLDAKLRVAMRGELTRLHHQYKTTTLYVTHDQVEAMTLGDRIAVLNAGRLQQVGTPDELYRRPCNVFVAGFIGSPSMNLAAGEIRPGDGDTPMLALGDHVWPIPAEQIAGHPALRNLVGHKVIVGLRPQAIVVDTGDPAAPAARLEVVAAAVESLGAEKNVLFTPPFEVPDALDAAETDPDYPAVWTATASADTTLTAGAPVTLRLDLAHAYFFDADTGLAIGNVA
jgi:multiple sugar transport system ATP-binding protein